MQKRPTNQTKPTNEALAPTIRHQDQPGSVPEKGGGQSRQSGAGRTHGSAEPGQALVQVHFGGKADLILLKSVADVSIQGDGGNQPIQAIKGASSLSHHTHHLKASLSHSLVTCTP